MADHNTNRRTVLRTSGATLAALSTGALVGSVSAYGEPAVRTEYSTVSGNYVTTHGLLDSVGDDDSADVWFEWGPEGDGLPYDTRIITMHSPDIFCDGYKSDCPYNSYGSLDSGTYEYRAVAYNDNGGDAGRVKTFTIY
jgi:hypothetical protein